MKLKYVNMTIWGLVTLAAVLVFSTPVVETEEVTAVKEISDEMSYVEPADIKVCLTKTRNTDYTISVRFVVDTMTFFDNIDFNLLVAHIDRDFTDANTSVKLDSIVYSGLDNPDFRRLVYKCHDDSYITVYITGIHEEDIIGLSTHLGYIYSRRSVAVDLTQAISYTGKANMISHEIGHLFGCEHTHLGDNMMAPFASEENHKFRKSHCRKIEKILGQM